MVTNSQVRRLRKLMQQDGRLNANAQKTGLDEKTARKYRRSGLVPSEMAKLHTWRTREDPFEEFWPVVRPFLVLNAGLEAKTLFEYLQRLHPGKLSDGQLRTFQRKVRRWRALEGPPKEVFFDQEHRPGVLSQSDFTHMKSLGVSICGEPFDHLIYHFVLTFSNWETGRICFSESFETLSYGLQEAMWELGGVPEVHQIDRMSAAVQKPESPDEFTRRYQALLDHYRLAGRKIQARKPNENGDVEQRHHRFKRALDQTLMLRGSRDFSSRQAYQRFLELLFVQLNAGRRQRFEEELKLLRSLPRGRLDICKRLPEVSVSRGSLIWVQKNRYSIDSRLIGQKVPVSVYANHLEVRYAGRCIEQIPRLRGEGKHHVQYRHIIDWLVKKPGAFENYRYRDDLFPSSRFRRAYDELKSRHALQKASREYLSILKLAADEGEMLVEGVLAELQDSGEPLGSEAVACMVADREPGVPLGREIHIDEVDFAAYDALLESTGVGCVGC